MQTEGIFDLADRTGLPLTLAPDGQLRFGSGLAPVAPVVRRLSDMRGVLRQRQAEGPEELYFMYRDVARDGDRERLRAAGLRYDVTVIRPGRIGDEYVKTAGHYHPAAGAGDVTYPEIYEVAAGKALFLLQRAAPPYRSVTDVVAVAAGPGERLLVPPGYGHITINPGPGLLVLTNVVEASFVSVYEPVQALQGGAYYAVAGPEGVAFVVNERYGDVPPLRRAQAPHWPEYGIVPEAPLYRDVAAAPERFRYLVEPGRLPVGLI